MSGVLIERSRIQGELIWLLEVDGLEDTYYSSPSAPTLPAYTQPWAHTAKGGITRVTAAPQDLDVVTSITSLGQVAVTIGITRTNAAGQLMKFGKSGATRTVTLAVTVPQTSLTVVEVNEDISAWPATGQIWIGKECINYNARTVVAPFQFSIANRAWWGSEQRKHTANPASGTAPRVYDACVTWKSRKARVLVTSRRYDGSQATGWIEQVSGRIAANPEIAPDGLSLSVNITPNTEAIETAVGGGLLRTGFQPGYHTFDGETADTFEIAIGWAQGAAFSERLTVATAPAGITLTLPYADHFNSFDFTNGGPGRRGDVFVRSAPSLPLQVVAPGYTGSATDGTGFLTVDPVVAGAAIGTEVLSVESFDLLSASVLAVQDTEETMQWPDDALDRISAALSPGVYIGAGGQFADVGIDPERSVLSFKLNANPKAPLTVRMVTWVPTPARLHYGISLFAPGAPMSAASFEWRNGQQALVAYRTETLEAHDPTREIGNDETIEGALAVPIRGVPSAYYQGGEKYIHVADDVVSTGSTIVITTSDFDGTKRTFPFGTVKTIPALGGAPGFLIQLDENTRLFSSISFGDWPNQSPTTIEESVAWADTPTSTVLLNLLMSGDGSLFNSAYDIFPNGANLTASEVNVDSFLRFPYPDGVAATQTFTLNDFDSTTVRDIIEPILKSIGGALVVSLARVADAGDGGVLRRRISLVPTGMAYAGDAASTITNGDWVGDQRPATPSDDQVINAIRFSLNYSAVEDEFKLVDIVSDGASIDEFEMQPIEDIELRGVRINAANPVDQLAQLTPLSTYRFAMLGAPRRMAEGSVSSAAALLLDAGASVIVSADSVYGYDGERGVSAQPMRVVSIEDDGYEATAKIKLTWHDSTVSGWAPSLKVAGVTAANIYTVEANAYTELTDPVTSATLADVDYWTAGDSVRACPLGDYGNSTAGLTILSIVGNVVTLSANAVPALVVGDTLRPGAWTAVATTSAQQAYAYLADDAGGLGAAPDSAKTYA